ncbi:MAG TPA: hypothetical protein VFS25_18935 [Chitinophaga sp.]|uniref:hypothetical protein n=1 Tax=Chitinophaga sp. TaxID=1869181 RepID=UPI002DBAEAD5|nr:hypothetical protein [Chitinophaga sp.]HEU4554933.1 hypothetical protein [Chitinophaga sp.]
MLKAEKRWLTISLVNLAIVALLGLLLRSKILFPLPGINFGFLLHAHSHFAFTGWVTLCLLTLITYKIVPAGYNSRPVYQWLLGGMLVSAVGMLLSFPFEGYAAVSIVFSTLSILVSYAFAWVLVKHVLSAGVSRPVMILLFSALAALVLSSAGPFTLAYIMASHKAAPVLYRNAIYTYLHLQYNGFFTLGILALFVHDFSSAFNGLAGKHLNRFAIALSVSVLPTLCLSYLWHSPNMAIRIIAIAGCACLAAALTWFIAMLWHAKTAFGNVHPFAKKLGALALISFVLKTAMQVIIVIPAAGNMVFANRPVIIGYLHLIMLGFITLYLLGCLMQQGYFTAEQPAAKAGIIIFTWAIVANEVVLMGQGFSYLLWFSSIVYPWLLWIAAIGLFTGAVVIAAAALRRGSEVLLFKNPGGYKQRDYRPAQHANNRVYTAGNRSQELFE